MTSENIDWRSLNHTAITRALTEQVMDQIDVVNKYNETHSSDSKTTTADIDKALREIAEKQTVTVDKVSKAVDDKDLIKAAKDFVKAEAAFKAVAKANRDNFRTQFLGETVVEGSVEEEDEVQQIRKVAYGTVSLLADMSKSQGLDDVFEFITRLPVPQVGRKGNSVVGLVKPRAQVKYGEVVWDSFAAAAKGLTDLLSDNDTTVKVSTEDLIRAWMDDNQPTNAPWVFKNLELVVVPKEK